METPQKKIKIEYFSYLKEITGMTSQTWHTFGKTPLDVYQELLNRYSFPDPQKIFSIAINEEVQDWETNIQDGDTLAFLPPFAGG